MVVKKNVFASRSERANFRKLCRAWAREYAIYHNLPFLSVFEPRGLVDFSNWDLRPITLTDVEINRLKKTSIDYTLCDQNDAPLICIEFDGLQDGFNVGMEYVPGEQPSYYSPWRQEIMDLKLRVAFGSMFPYFVVGYKHFDDISASTRLTIVDGIIGEVLASKATHDRFAEGFDPKEKGMTQEEFDALSSPDQQEIVQDWALGVEVGASMEHNPVTRERWSMEAREGGEAYTIHYLTHPDADHARTQQERVKMIANALLQGIRIALHTADVGDVEATVWLPNFRSAGFTGLGLLEDVAYILAMEKVRRLRASTSS